MENQLTVFENKAIRSVEHNDEMYFSIVDIMEVLTDSSNPSNYWNMLKKRENQLYTVCVPTENPIILGNSFCNSLESVWTIDLPNLRFVFRKWLCPMPNTGE